MTIGRTRPIRLRFTFNYRSKQVSRDKIRGFSSALAQDVAINASEEMWVLIKERLERQLAIDAMREVSRMAQLYKQLIIGISGGRSGPYGTLTPAASAASGFETRYQLRGTWAPRSQAYLAQKRRAPPSGVGHERWFQHHGVLNRSMGAGRTWTAAFGPVKVAVTRVSSMSTKDGRGGERFNAGHTTSGSGQVVRVQVANIRVSALEAITPRMLPAIQNGNIDDMPADGRKTGLIGRFPGDIAIGLGGNEKFVPYRHTVEPFLGFVLTRAIPNAVARRLQDTLGADIRSGEGAQRR